ESGVDAAAVEAGTEAKTAATPAKSSPAEAPVGRQGQLAFGMPAPKGARAAGETNVLTPLALSNKRIEALRGTKIDAAKYETIESPDSLNRWVARAYDTGVLALKTETSSIDPMQTALCGIALAVAPNEAAYLPLGHREASGEEASGLFAAKLCQGQIPEKQ